MTLEFCRYYAFSPSIPAGKRARIEIEGNENPTGVIEVFVAPDGWTPTKAAPRPPDPRRTSMNGNGKTSVVGPGMLVLHLAAPPDRRPARADVYIID